MAETTIYPLNERYRFNVKSNRFWAFCSLVLIIAAAALSPGFLWYQTLNSVKPDLDTWLALSIFFCAVALIGIITTAMGNYTIRVELHQNRCLISNVFGQKEIKYSEIGSIEKLEDFKCYRKLYYNFILLADQSGRELAIIWHTVENLDRLDEDLENRCRPYGAVRLGPNDSSGPGWRALTTTSARWNRAILVFAILCVLGVVMGGLYDLRADLNLYYHGQVITATIYQHDLKARPCARYKFTLDDGREFRRRFKKCDSVALGDEVTVKYWPTDPRKNRVVNDLKFSYFSVIFLGFFVLLLLLLVAGLFFPETDLNEFRIRGRSYKIPETTGRPPG